MIWNSHIWKGELKRELKKFNKYLKDITSNKYDVDHFAFGLEKFYFNCAFIMRKLIENGKISNELLTINFKCSKYKRINKTEKLDMINYIEFFEYYDLENVEEDSISIKQVCNLFVHSYVFFPTFDEDNEMKFSGIFINTDHSKDDFIYHLDYHEFNLMINDVLKDDILSIQYNRTTGKTKRSSKPSV
jgi:hypothetical protein